MTGGCAEAIGKLEAGLAAETDGGVCWGTVQAIGGIAAETGSVIGGGHEGRGDT